jgi:cysteine synthase A
MHEKGQRGTVVTVLCDLGERYTDTYYDSQWLRSQKIDPVPWQRTVERFFATGKWQPPAQ